MLKIDFELLLICDGGLSNCTFPFYEEVGECQFIQVTVLDIEEG